MTFDDIVLESVKVADSSFDKVFDLVLKKLERREPNRLNCYCEYCMAKDRHTEASITVDYYQCDLKKTLIQSTKFDYRSGTVVNGSINDAKRMLKYARQQKSLFYNQMMAAKYLLDIGEIQHDYR